VGGSSEPQIVSGALAARVRENTAVCLTAIGGEAVAKTIRAICHARLYLEVRARPATCIRTPAQNAATISPQGFCCQIPDLRTSKCVTARLTCERWHSAQGFGSCLVSVQSSWSIPFARSPSVCPVVAASAGGQGGHQGAYRIHQGGEGGRRLAQRRALQHHRRGDRVTGCLRSASDGRRDVTTRTQTAWPLQHEWRHFGQSLAASGLTPRREDSGHKGCFSCAAGQHSRKSRKHSSRAACWHMAPLSRCQLRTYCFAAQAEQPGTVDHELAGRLDCSPCTNELVYLLSVFCSASFPGTAAQASSLVNSVNHC